MVTPTNVESLIADAPLSARLATSVDDRPCAAAVRCGHRDGVLLLAAGASL